jgi:hypothetical protein
MQRVGTHIMNSEEFPNLNNECLYVLKSNEIQENPSVFCVPSFSDICDCNSILTIEILHIVRILKLICAYSNKPLNIFIGKFTRGEGESTE